MASQTVDYDALADRIRQAVPTDAAPSADPGSTDYDALAQRIRSATPHSDTSAIDDLTIAKNAKATPPTSPSLKHRILQRVVQQIGPEPFVAADVLKGAAKSVIGAVAGGGKLVREIPGVGPALASVGSLPIMPSSQPTNTAQKVGKAAMDVGQFFIPGAAAGRAAELVKTGQALIDALSTVAAEATGAAAVGAAQSGSVKGGVRAGAATAALGAAAPLAKKGLTGVGHSIEWALTKPTTADFNDGFRIENIFKYDLGGTLEQTYAKAQAKITELTAGLKSALSTVKPGQQPTIDLVAAMKRTMDKMKTGAARNFGKNYAIKEAGQKLYDEIWPSLAGQSRAVRRSGKVDLLVANQFKQATGDIGSWFHGLPGKPPETDALETVANVYYDELKREIEQKSAGPVARINKQISDLISIRRAVARRIPVAARANVLNLGDLLALSHGTGWVAVANRLLRSGQVANAAVKAGASTLIPAAAKAGASAAAANTDTSDAAP